VNESDEYEVVMDDYESAQVEDDTSLVRRLIDTDLPEQAAIEQAIPVVVDMVKQTTQATLMMYWELGGLVAQLDGAYGSNAIKNFAEALSNALGDNSYHESTLYKARTFYSTYSTKKDIDLFLDSGISWTQITKVLHSKIKPEVVVSVANRVQANEIAPSEFGDVVRDKTPELQKAPEPKSVGASVRSQSHGKEIKDPKGAGKRTFAGDLQRLAGVFELTLDNCGDLIILADDYSKLSDEDKSSFFDQFEELKYLLDETEEALLGAIKVLADKTKG